MSPSDGSASLNQRPERHGTGRAALSSTTGAHNTGRPGLLMSIQPRHAAAILSGYKTVELRRRPPKARPPVVVIYGSGTDRSVVGTARLLRIHTSTPDEIWTRFGTAAGVTRDEFDAYFAGCELASALELTGAEPAAERLPLPRLRSLGLEPPQSWRYIDAAQLNALIAALHPECGHTGTATQASLLPLEGGPALRRALRPIGWAWHFVKSVR